MSKYTLTIKQIMENKVEIFDFEYPIFNENHRKELEKLILDHYYFREIGVETVGRFKHYLRNKMNLIMPFYNQLYMTEALDQRILDNYDVTETFDKTNMSMGTTTADGENLSLQSDTPGSRVDITTNDYVSKIDKDKNNSNIVNSNDGSEKWTRTMKGNIGVQTDADAIQKFRETLIRIDMMIIDELNELFMGVY